MNKKNVLRLAEHLEKIAQQTNPFVGFTMYDYATCEHECGTAGCIAGHIYLLRNGPEAFEMAAQIFEQFQCGDGNVSVGPVTRIHPEGAAWLGIDTETSNNLFLMNNSRYSLSEVTPEWAAATLRRLAKTGEVDWEFYPRKKKWNV